MRNRRPRKPYDPARFDQGLPQIAGDDFHRGLPLLTVWDDSDHMGADEIGGLFSSLKKGFKSVGKAVKQGTKLVAKAGRTIGKGLGKIPVVGAGIKGAFDLTLNAPFQMASKIASGQRLDRVAMGTLKSSVKSLKQIAPYATTVLSFVPIVGTGINAGIGAGLALAGGQPIGKALLAGVQGALPGGALAQSAFSVAQAAVQGKSITSIALAALPVNTNERRAIALGLNAAGRIAKGERVDESILHQAESAIRMLPKEARTALQVGLAVGQGKNLQKVALENIAPAALSKIQADGLKLAQASPALMAAGKALTSTAARSGYAVGVGMIPDKSAFRTAAIRHQLPVAQRAGFDLAIELRNKALAATAARAAATTAARPAPKPAPAPAPVPKPPVKAPRPTVARAAPVPINRDAPRSTEPGYFVSRRTGAIREVKA